MYPSRRLGTSLRLKAWFQSNFRSAPHKTARGQFESARPAAFPRFGLKIGSSAAHDGFCLMLLGSPPDMVHSPPLRSTGLSSPCWQLPRHAHVPLRPHHPRCSGLRVQGTAISPTSAALLRAGAGTEAKWYCTILFPVSQSQFSECFPVMAYFLFTFSKYLV